MAGESEEKVPRIRLTFSENVFRTSIVDKKSNVYAKQQGLISSDNGHDKINDTDYNYRICGKSIPCLSIFANPVSYLIWFSLALFFKHFISYGCIYTLLPSLLIRYKLSRNENLIIKFISNISCVLTIIPISFYGNKRHKPTYVGIGTVLMGIGCIIFASPHFFSGIYIPENIIHKNISFCVKDDINVDNEIPLNDDCYQSGKINQLNKFKYFFYIGQFLTGTAGATLFSLGFAYFEEIYNKRLCAFCIGISLACQSCGSLVGKLVMQNCLTLYVDIPLSSINMIQNNDERWVGAWWIPHLIVGFIVLLLSLPLITFPKINKRIKKNDIIHVNEKLFSLSDIFHIVKIFRNLATNIPYVFITISITLEKFSLLATGKFNSDYIVNVFGITQHKANIISDSLYFPNAIMGSLLGGILLKIYKWKLNGTLMFLGIVTLLSTPFTVAYIMTCDHIEMNGITTGYLGFNITSKNLSAHCNLHCHCDESEDYFPLCGIDKHTFYSPCFAGCSSMNMENNVMKYNYCSCVEGYEYGIQITDGKCRPHLCAFFYLNLCFVGVILFFRLFRRTPLVTGTMLAVKSNEIAVALACQSAFSELISFTPGPKIFGEIISQACLLWNKKCDELLECVQYDISKFTRSYFISILSLSALSTICFVIPMRRI